MTSARLILEDDTVFRGASFGAPVSAAGEVVFNTGMVGYPESLTDPSYRGQILTLTYPLIGNYGVPNSDVDAWGWPRHFESHRIHAAGLVISELSPTFSHHQARLSLHDWLHREGIPGLAGIDTRALTKRLREKGTLLGRIETAGESIPFVDPNAMDLVSMVSVTEVSTFEPIPAPTSETPATVVVVDCGCKVSIMRQVLARGFRVIRVPHDYYFPKIRYDGLVISNGPGDPKICRAAIQNVARALAIGKPILGICLGHQILALAVGADTYKLKFGHRSQNQPCVELPHHLSDLASHPGHCVITSQNHGYAVQEEGLPEGWEVWFSNANDGTVEGIRHITKPFLGVQFHPEATPGPTDTAWVFDLFAKEVRQRL